MFKVISSISPKASFCDLCNGGFHLALRGMNQLLSGQMAYSPPPVLVLTQRKKQTDKQNRCWEIFLSKVMYSGSS